MHSIVQFNKCFCTFVHICAHLCKHMCMYICEQARVISCSRECNDLCITLHHSYNACAQLRMCRLVCTSLPYMLICLYTSVHKHAQHAKLIKHTCAKIRTYRIIHNTEQHHKCLCTFLPSCQVIVHECVQARIMRCSIAHSCAHIRAHLCRKIGDVVDVSVLQTSVASIAGISTPTQWQRGGE